jgi:lysophospholipase L1-like esterase
MKNIPSEMFHFIASLIFCTTFCIFSETLIPAHHTAINYYGRFDVSTPTAPQFNWSESAIEAAFPGPSIGFKLTDGNADYDVEIDGAVDTMIQTKSSITKYTIATNLSEGRHTIRIVQRSENHWNAAVFGGFYLADGKDLLTAPLKPNRKIEFIGDSYTASYGNESPGRDCSQTQLRFYTNANRGFGSLTTKAFHAQSINLGWSGAGMVRNYGESAKKSSDPYPTYYGKTLGSLEGVWDFSRWVPNLVVICLGTNDFSTTPHPDDTMFTNAYHSFITRIRTNYPDIPILCVSTDNPPLPTLVKQIVAAETTSIGHKKIYGTAFPSLEFNGCDWHPTVSEDSAIAKVLISSITQYIGWDTAKSSIISPNYIEKQCIMKNFSIVVSSKWVKIIGTSLHPADLQFSLIDLQGRTVMQATIDIQNSMILNTSNVRSGLYLLGNKHMGWKSIVVK